MCRQAQKGLSNGAKRLSEVRGSQPDHHSMPLPASAGVTSRTGGACSLRPWWHAGGPPARFPTAHTTGGRATREVGNSTLRDPKCDLPHAAASEGRVGSPCPPHLAPAVSRRRRRGTFQAKQPASPPLGNCTGGLATRRAGHPRAKRKVSDRSAGSPQPPSTLRYAGSRGARSAHAKARRRSPRSG